MQQIAMRWRLPLACACALGGCLSHAADLKIEAQPAFIGYATANGTLPVAVVLKNIGPDASGSLRVSCGDFQMDYPLDLPRGSVKRLIAYPQINYGSEVSLDLSTNRGNLHGLFRPIINSDPSSLAVLFIGDNEGDLGFLRPEGTQMATRMSGCYVKPELAPDRPVAYGSINAVVLGGGAERLPDAAVKALHSYIASGGTLAFVGGASSPVLSDRRWADVVPVTPKQPKTIDRSTLVANLSKSPLGSAFTILDCVPLPQAATRREGSNIILARRDFGLGKTVFIAFNPFEPPFSRWPGKRALFEKVLRPFDSMRAMRYLRQFRTVTDNDSGYTGAYYTTSVAATGSTTTGGTYYPSASSGGGTVYPERASADPFNTKLPEPTKVFWILASYFVVIVPINFILLKKLKRGEWAWFTAPIISIGFAGAFFAAAKDLYSAKLSSATQGLIVATDSGIEPIFVGKSQLFFPQGGEYDLKMEGLESVGASDPTEEYGYGYGQRGGGSLTELNAVDIGHVLVPRMNVNNLAFRELAYQQNLPASKWLTVTLKGRTLTIRNNGQYVVKEPVAIVAGQQFPLKDAELGPGEVVALNLPITIEPEQDPDQISETYGYGVQQPQFGGLPEMTFRTKAIVIKGTVNDVPVGPGIGTTVAGRQSIALAYFTGLHYGPVQL